MRPSSVVTHLEAPLSAYRNPGVPARDVVVLALRWDTPHWQGLAVAWLEQGLPVDHEIAGLLEAVDLSAGQAAGAAASRGDAGKVWRGSGAPGSDAAPRC